jgi:hypothetical protein
VSSKGQYGKAFLYFGAPVIVPRDYKLLKALRKNMRLEKENY